MARIVVFAKPDNDNADTFIDNSKFKRGMAVDILEDGMEVGTEVEASPWFRVIEAPGPAVNYGDLLGSDPEWREPALRRSLDPMPRKRVTALDLDALEVLANTPPGRPDLALTLPAAAIAAHKVTLAKRANPNVIGGDAVTPVIG